MMSLFTVSVIFLSVSYYFQLSSSVIQLPFIIVTIGRSLLHVVHYSWHMLTNCIYTERNLASLLISSYSLSPVLQIYFHFVVFFFPKNHRIIVFFRWNFPSLFMLNFDAFFNLVCVFWADCTCSFCFWFFMDRLATYICMYKASFLPFIALLSLVFPCLTCIIDLLCKTISGCGCSELVFALCSFMHLQAKWSCRLYDLCTCTWSCYRSLVRGLASTAWLGKTMAGTTITFLFRLFFLIASWFASCAKLSVMNFLLLLWSHLLWLFPELIVMICFHIL